MLCRVTSYQAPLSLKSCPSERQLHQDAFPLASESSDDNLPIKARVRAEVQGTIYTTYLLQKPASILYIYRSKGGTTADYPDVFSLLPQDAQAHAEGF